MINCIVLDTSGSMFGKRWSIAQEFLAQMSDEEVKASHFFLFNSSTRKVTYEEALRATCKGITNYVGLVDTLGQFLQQVDGVEVVNVVMLSDGYPALDAESMDIQHAKLQMKTYTAATQHDLQINVLGIDQGNEADLREMTRMGTKAGQFMDLDDPANVPLAMRRCVTTKMHPETAVELPEQASDAAREKVDKHSRGSTHPGNNKPEK